MTNASEGPLIARCRAEEETLAEVRYVLRSGLLRIGLDDISVPAQLQNAHLRRDLSDGGLALVGEWRRPRDKRLGAVVIHESGRLFAELFVGKPLPCDALLLVDAVAVFGTAGQLAVELQLVEYSSELPRNADQLDLVDQHPFRRTFSTRVG